jgi:hypothetical protein
VASLELPHALFSARVEAPLRELILRMLSLRPELRGTAVQLARDLERAATSVTRERLPTHSRTKNSEDGQHPGAETSRGHPHLRAAMHSWRAWLATAATVGALATWGVWMISGAPEAHLRADTRKTGATGPADTGPVGLGDAAVSASTGDSPAPSLSEAMAEDTLPEPEPGQAKPDTKGRCPHKQQVALNNGCWMKASFEQEQCESVGGSMYQGACYLPIIAPRQRPPTTAPTMRLRRHRKGAEQPEHQAGSR